MMRKLYTIALEKNIVNTDTLTVSHKTQEVLWSRSSHKGSTFYGPTNTGKLSKNVKEMTTLSLPLIMVNKATASKNFTSQKQN